MEHQHNRIPLKATFFQGFCFLGHPMMISTKTTWSEVLEGKRRRSERDQMEWKMKDNKNQNRYKSKDIQ